MSQGKYNETKYKIKQHFDITFAVFERNYNLFLNIGLPKSTHLKNPFLNFGN